MKEKHIPPVVLHMAITMNEIEKQNRIKKGLCPQCETELINQNGCKNCPFCGWSVCGD